MSSEGDYVFQVTTNSTDINKLSHVRPRCSVQSGPLSLLAGCVSRQPRPLVRLEITQRNGEETNELPWSADQKYCASSEPVRGRSRVRMCLRHGHTRRGASHAPNHS